MCSFCTSECCLWHNLALSVSQFNLLQWQKITLAKNLVVLCWFNELDHLSERSSGQQTKEKVKNIQPWRKERREKKWEVWEEGGQQKTPLLANAARHCISSSANESRPCTNSSGCCSSYSTRFRPPLLTLLDRMVASKFTIHYPSYWSVARQTWFRLW